MNFQEQRLQMQLATWLDSQRILHCASLGGVPMRNKRIGGIMKAKGYRKGFPDHQILEARGGWHGMFIEIKVQNTKKQESQDRWRVDLIARGYYAVKVQGTFDFWEARAFIENQVTEYMAGRFKREPYVVASTSKS